MQSHITKISEQDQKILEEESNAIIAEIKSRKKFPRKHEQASAANGKGTPEEQTVSSKDVSNVEKNLRSLRDKPGGLLRRETPQVTSGSSPMVYNEIKMNTVNEEQLDKSIDGMERFNRVLSSRESFNSIEDSNVEEKNVSSPAEQKKPVEVPPNFVVSSPSKSRGRQKLYPRLNMALNFDESHQSSPSDSHRGILEMSSGLEVTNNTNSSNYNFRLPLEDSQEMSQSADVIKNKIFDDGGEWDAAQTSGKVFKNNDDRGNSYALPLLKRKDTGRPADAELNNGPEKPIGYHSSLRKEIASSKNNDYLSQSFNSDRSGASSSCSLLYNKEMGLICKKCFDTSCCHMDEVNDIDAFSTSKMKNQTTNYETSEIGTQEESIDDTKQDDKEDFSEMEQNESRQDRSSSLKSTVQVRSTQERNATGGKIRNINGKNVHLTASYDSLQEGYSSERRSWKHERDLPPFSRQDYRDNRDNRMHLPNGFTQNTITPFDNALTNKHFNDSQVYDLRGAQSLPSEQHLYNIERFLDEPSSHLPRQSSGYEAYEPDYQNKLAKIQDNRRNLNHLLMRTTPLSSNFASNDEVGVRSTLLLPFTDTSISNEPDTPKTGRRSNSIIAASDLETVFEVDERTSSTTPKPSIRNNSGSTTNIVANNMADSSDDEEAGHVNTQSAEDDPSRANSHNENNAVHKQKNDRRSPSYTPEYDEKDQILQLLDQARSILNLKKRKTSKDCFINTDKIYNRNMMKANSALSSGGRLSPKKKPKTASPPAVHDGSILPEESIEKVKSAPSILEGRSKRTEQNAEERSSEKRKDEDKDLDVALNLDLWVNTSAISSAIGKAEEKKKGSYVSNESDKEHISSQNSTPSPGDSGIELNNSSSNSIAIDSKRDIDTLSKDKRTIGLVQYPKRSNKNNYRISLRNQRILQSNDDVATNENENENIAEARRIFGRRKDDYTDVYSKRWTNSEPLIDKGDEKERFRHPFVNRLYRGRYRSNNNPESSNRTTISDEDDRYINSEQYRQHVTNKTYINGGTYEPSGDWFHRSLSSNAVTDLESIDGRDANLLQRQQLYNRTLSLPNQRYVGDRFPPHPVIADPYENVDNGNKWLSSSLRKPVPPNSRRENENIDVQHHHRDIDDDPLSKYDNNESYLHRRNDMIPPSTYGAYLRNFNKSLPVVPPDQARFSRLNSDPVHSKKSYRLTDHIISQVRSENKFVERMMSVEAPRHEVDEFTPVRLR